MALNADFTAVDLSEKMILQGVHKMNARGAPVDFIICNATRLLSNLRLLTLSQAMEQLMAMPIPKPH